MKTRQYTLEFSAKIFLVGLFCGLFLNENKAQQQIFTSTNNGSAHLFENSSDGNHWIGISAFPTGSANLFTSEAPLHIRLQSSICPSYPLFKVDIADGLQKKGISFMFNEDNIDYGIRQESSLLINNFRGATLFGSPNASLLSILNDFSLVSIGKGFFNDTLSLKRPLYFYHNENHQSGITWESTDLDDVFSFTNKDVRSNTIWYPLMLDPMLGVITHRLLQADSIKILKGAGLNKVLVSDAEGNGTWTDGSNFHDDDWLPMAINGDGIAPFYLYLNSSKYSNVGIGTERPWQKLHMVNGNIMISRNPDEAPGSKNGSILFGEVISNLCPNGEWGIEYYSDERGYSAGGLNFWKVYTEGNGNPGADHCMFIRNDGNVGIATNQPMDRFQVNDGYEKTTIGSAIDFSTVSGTSYIGFNSARINKSSWTLSSNGVNNGGNMTFGDINGNYYIVTVPSIENGTTSQTLSDDEVFSKVRLTVTDEGNVGIGTKETHGYKLAVQGKILCENLKVQLAEDWPVIPDFVFNKDYRLPSLKDIESYIKQNNHLPGIPSAGEMKEQGIDMVEMNTQLLQKVEELTLYLIQQQKTIEQQQRQIDDLIKSFNLK